MTSKPTKYRATFADGTIITRKSHRTYSHAWRVTCEKVTEARPNTYERPKGFIYEHKGFSGSESLAQSAAAYARNGMNGNWRTLTHEIVAVETLD